jgi:HAD superfamily hydrolase (TIGR01549 family)
MTPKQRENAERILLAHEEKAVAESTLNPGAREVLDELRRRKIQIGILTRNKRDNAFAVAEKHGLKFDAVVGREEGPVKPDAFGVQYLCRQFGIKPGESLVVGDYLFDLLCARAAGAIPVLLKNHRKADEFARYADFVIENITDILKIIEDK